MINKKNKLTLSAIESITGGLFSSQIVAKPGASEFFLGALIAYSDQIKQKLGIDIQNGVINPQIAKALALKGKEFFQSDVCVAFVGNAGPKRLENKPLGVVYIAINQEVFKLNLLGTRNQIRQQATQFALQKLHQKFNFKII